MNQENRGSWYLLTGLLIGVGLGLSYAWLVSPVQYIDTEPRTLAAPYKEQYRKIIALAYQVERDIGRARERVLLLDADDPVRVLAAQAQRMIAADAPAEEARALSILASDLGKPADAVTVITDQPAAETREPAEIKETETMSPDQTPVLPSATIDPGEAIRTATLPVPTVTSSPTQTATVTVTPLPTFTPRPTSTARLIPDMPFRLLERNELCGVGQQPGLILIQVTDDKGQPLAGVRVVVTWENGEEIFYTGLVPEIGPGYADFKVTPGVVYSVRVGDASQEVREVTVGSCSLLLAFTQQP